MIERLAAAAAFIAIATLLGLAVRQFSGTRSRRLASAAILPANLRQSARLLVFTSKWCSDCITQHAMIEHTRDTWSRPVEVSYHDAVAEGEFARQFGIMMVPALVVARPDGAIVGVRQGLVDEDRLRSLIEAAA